MAITYVNDLRLSEMDTGDNSGTWGTVTNTNLELIGEALGYGTEAITTNADTHASVIADGSTDPVRAMYVKYTGTLDSACTITISPNTVNKFYYIENATSGSQNIIISQGSGANVTIPAGDTKAVYLDGAGSGAAVTDAFASLNVVDLKVQDDLTVTDDASVGGDLLVSGEVQTANIGFTDGDNAMTIADGGAVTFPIASVFTGGFAANAACTITTADNLSGLIVASTDADAQVGPTLQLKRNSGSPADADNLGNIIFVGENDADEAVVYGNIGFTAPDVSDGTEDGLFFLNVINAGTERSRMFMNATETVFNEEHLDINFRIEGDTLPNLFHVDAGDDSIGINSEGVGGALVTVQGRSGSDGSEITTKGVHIIEGGYNNGNTFQVSDSSSNARFAVNGYGSASVGGDTTLAQWFNADGTYGTKFQVQTLGDDTDQNYVTAAFIKSRNDTSPSYVVIGKNRGGAVNSDTTINGGDSIGAISFQGADGTTYQEAARIASEAGSGWGANDGVANIEFYTNSGTTSVAKRMTVQHDSGNNVEIEDGLTLKDGNLIIGGAGHGIDFSAQTASSASGASTSSEILDHYEEGTWAPVITPEGGSAASLTVNHASYTKIGRLVSVVFQVTIDSISGTSAVNAIELTGLPFTLATSAAGGPNISYTNLNALPGGNLALQGNTTTRYRIVNTNLTSGDNASDHLKANSVLRGQFVFHAA